jgi:hypothetical protein
MVKNHVAYSDLNRDKSCEQSACSPFFIKGLYILDSTEMAA